MDKTEKQDEVTLDDNTVSADDGDYSLFDDGPPAEDIIRRLGLGVNT